MKPFRTIAAAAAVLGVLAVPAAASAAIPQPRPAAGMTRTPTVITAFHRYSPGPIAVTGTLTTAAGAALPGQLVTFTESTRVLCTAVTDASGLAACNVTMGQVTQTRLDGGTFTSRFTGTITLAPVQNTGHI